MVELHHIYKCIEDSGAQLYLYNIGFADAATLKLNGQYAVFVDTDAVASIRGLKGDLCHECGHVATGALHQIDSPYDIVERHEYKADRWFAETFINPIDIQEAFKAGYHETWELSDWFDLPEEDIKKALHYWVECRGVNFGEVK
ncbi:hypothetical protein [Pygmaiobacter massiliensis]|uniref:hypothetical protein n=1 Tax=Pygmaiobacter massiliensis TaxID=1917873 RepID=UPI002A805A66|nr:hypothetical protein [Pygmaiobacter massiliensis]MDY4785510.1 hypothetical protein [Pygmaiobacter massiliensis]